MALRPASQQRAAAAAHDAASTPRLRRASATAESASRSWGAYSAQQGHRSCGSRLVHLSVCIGVSLRFRRHVVVARRVHRLGSQYSRFVVVVVRRNVAFGRVLHLELFGKVSPQVQCAV